ncbi:phage tail protein [Euzebya tangerina]|uniref:phage tail protein n=1 Tax=Euzebya tangerina TaxID=591198 RepID=UPI000E30F714|nr:tail fiber protein [Euzebya tangerina]
MSEPFLAEIRIFAGNFAPRGWAFCDGQLLPIAQNTALFSLIGTTYGGDGRTTTALPDLQGRAPMHPGRGPGLTSRRLGEAGGTETVTLTEAQMPNHQHSLLVSDEPAQADDAGGAVPAVASQDIWGAAADLAPMGNDSLTTTGGSQAHNNVQPVLVLNYIIALQGLYPSRS